MRNVAALLVLAVLLGGCASPNEPGTPEPTATGSTPSEALTTTADEPSVTSTSSTSSSASSTSTSPSPTQAPPPPSKDADLLVLRAFDLGSGWVDEEPQPGPGEATNQTDDAKTSLSRSSGMGTPWLVETTVRVFATVADARAEFEAAKQQVPASSRTSVTAGDEAFVWVHPSSLGSSWEEGWVLEGRVVWYVYAAGDGGTPSPTTASLLQTCAAKQ